MALVSSLTCISSALDDLHSLEFLCHTSPDPEAERFQLGRLKVQLGKFRIFLVCATKWGDEQYDDPSAGALVVRTGAAISRMGEGIRSLYLTISEAGLYHISILNVLPGRNEMDSLNTEINRWYSFFKFCSSSDHSRLVKKDDLMEFMDSVVDHMREDIHNFKVLPIIEEKALSEALQLGLTFLRNLICFVTLYDGGLEHWQLRPLLSHAKFVAVNAASLFFGFRPMDLDCVPDLLQKIIHVEPQVHEARVQALIASKLSSTQSFKGEPDDHFLTDFVDSLQFYLWEILKTKFGLVISLKDQLLILWEGLRYLGTILKRNPKFDEKMRDLTRLFLCDAGLVLFSLSFSPLKDESVKDMDLASFNDFMERLKRIKATFSEVCPGTSSSSSSSLNFPRTDVLSFLDRLLKYLSSPKEDSSVVLLNYPIQTIHADLVVLRSFLEKIVEMRHEDEELQALWNCVTEVAYKVEFLIDSLLVGGIPYSCSVLFDSTVEELKIIKDHALKIFDTKRLDLKVLKEVAKRAGHKPSTLESKPMISNVVVGLEDEATVIFNRLTRGSSRLQIVPVVGMAGLGKTTLAQKVYDDPKIMSYFGTRAWCTVSQEYHKKNLLLEILSNIHLEHPKKFSEMCEEDLALEVKIGLLRNKYLIVLDDIWHTEVWNNLKILLPDNRNGSRVVLTSRKDDVAASEGELINEGPHHLRQLTDNESRALLNLKLFPERQHHVTPKLHELLEKIVKMCKGLPLMIVILAGFLANKDKNYLEDVLENLESSIVSGTEKCSATLELSYQDLPDTLKPCFLYFGSFLEDHEHIVEDLICRWVAEGFAQETQFKSAENVANDYLMGLISRSLVIVSRQRSIGGVKACRIHDLLHDFCVTKSTEENLSLFVHEHDDPYTLRVPQHLRRLCINRNPENFSSFRLFAPAIRSLSLLRDGKKCRGIGCVIRMFKLVRVLDLRRVNLYSFPEEVAFLVHLRYLSIQGYMDSIPPSIANLLYLETLIVGSHLESVSLPDAIWNLKKLRHLQIKEKSDISWFKFSVDNLDNAAKLYALHTLSAVGLPLGKLYKILRQFPNIRKLKCFLLDGIASSLGSADTILGIDFLVDIESLTLKSLDYHYSQYQFQFPSTV